MSSLPLFLCCHNGEIPKESSSNDKAPETTTRQDREEIEEATEKEIPLASLLHRQTRKIQIS
jgi:hypothetical protein